jgi:hypothetical protein
MKKNFRVFQINNNNNNGSSSRINRIIARKISKNYREALLIDKHILYDTHILKLNILGCDSQAQKSSCLLVVKGIERMTSASIG